MADLKRRRTELRPGTVLTREWDGQLRQVIVLADGFSWNGFVLRFLLQSVVAGTDAAWRALHPRLPLRPGFVTYPVQLAPGATRNTFCTLSSLLPGPFPQDRMNAARSSSTVSMSASRSQQS